MGTVPLESQLHPVLAGGTFGVITGDKPAFRPEVNGGHTALGQHIQDMGLKFEPSAAFHGPSSGPVYIVHNPTRNSLMELGRRFGQESVIFSSGGKHEQIYTSGPKAGKFHPMSGSGMEFFQAKPSIDQTVTQVPGVGYVRFNFDLGKLHDVPKAEGSVMSEQKKSEVSVVDFKKALAKSIRDSIEKFSKTLEDLRDREVAKSEEDTIVAELPVVQGNFELGAANCPVCNQPDGPGLCHCVVPLGKSQYGMSHAVAMQRVADTYYNHVTSKMGLSEQEARQLAAKHAQDWAAQVKDPAAFMHMALGHAPEDYAATAGPAGVPDEPDSYGPEKPFNPNALENSECDKCGDATPPGSGRFCANCAGQEEPRPSPEQSKLDEGLVDPMATEKAELGVLPPPAGPKVKLQAVREAGTADKALGKKTPLEAATATLNDPKVRVKAGNYDQTQWHVESGKKVPPSHGNKMRTLSTQEHREIGEHHERLAAESNKGKEIKGVATKKSATSEWGKDSQGYHSRPFPPERKEAADEPAPKSPSASEEESKEPMGFKAGTKKAEILEKPPVSEAQRRAMGAAASGKSNIGIPKKVGQEFIEKDPGGKLPETKKAEGEVCKACKAEVCKCMTKNIDPSKAPVVVGSVAAVRERARKLMAGRPQEDAADAAKRAEFAAKGHDTTIKSELFVDSKNEGARPTSTDDAKKGGPRVKNVGYETPEPAKPSKDVPGNLDAGSGGEKATGKGYTLGKTGMPVTAPSAGVGVSGGPGAGMSMSEPVAKAFGAAGPPMAKPPTKNPTPAKPAASKPGMKAPKMGMKPKPFGKAAIPSLRSPAGAADAAAHAVKTGTVKPEAPAVEVAPKNVPKSPESYSDFMPPGKFGKSEDFQKNLGNCVLCGKAEHAGNCE